MNKKKEIKLIKLMKLIKKMLWIITKDAKILKILYNKELKYIV